MISSKSLFRIFVCLFVLASTHISLQAQDDLDALLDDMASEQSNNQAVLATFKSGHIINGHSVEMIASGAMEYRISHRFGRLNSGSYNLWGLDQSTVRHGLDFGIFDWFNVGLGRSTHEKTFDGYIKLKSTTQMTQPKSTLQEFSSVFVAGMMIRGLDWPDKMYEEPFSNRYSYFGQFSIARKLNKRLSLQLTAYAVHQNLVESTLDENLRFAAGAGGRFKLSNRVAITGEYIARLPYSTSDYVAAYQDYDNSLSLGLDIETGGHVFQLHFTNSRAMFERGFINDTQGNWANGDIYFGFNITREFTLFSNKKH